MKKIAFCFLIYDIINHEEIWNIFFKNIDINKYNIYIHYKTNVPLKYFEKYKLNNCIDTKWGDISLVQAQNILYTEALKDTDNQHFINVSFGKYKGYEKSESFMVLFKILSTSVMILNSLFFIYCVFTVKPI